ncbi:MAG: SPOR domain-containing protein [Candidatus Omnitrophica bacterium]|nr:SPOR domain-containing protein [Candidatus Omnitrophota bacterium]
MNSSSKNQQIEFEVFPKENKTNYSYLSGIQGDTHTEGTQVNVVFSHQSVIIIFICAIMLLVASFSLGVEKGKLVAKNSLPVAVEKNFVENMAPQAAGMAIAETKSAPVAQGKVVIPVNGISAQTGENTIGTTVAAATATPAPAGGYTIQVASVKSESAAKILAETLTKKGISSFTRSSGKYIVVLAGNFAKMEEGRQSLKELKKSYSDCFLRKI